MQQANEEGRTKILASQVSDISSCDASNDQQRRHTHFSISNEAVGS